MATRKCTCGFTEFFERKTREELTSLRWIRYTEVFGTGLGSTPLGAEGLGSGIRGGILWAKVALDRTLVTLSVVCRSCGRVRLNKTLGGIGLVGSYVQTGVLYVVVSDLVDVGCYSVEFRGAERTYTVPLKRSHLEAAPLSVGVPVEQTYDPPVSDRGDYLLYAPLPVEVQDSGTYEMVLVDRCAQSETSLGTITLEDDEAMLIPLQTAEFDAPPLLLRYAGLGATDLQDELRYGGLGPSPYTLPFDKCTAVVEYDARLGTLPPVQGWTENYPGAGLFAVLNGTLVHSQPNAQRNNYTKAASLATMPDRVYAYAALRTTTDAAGSGEIIVSAGDGIGHRYLVVDESLAAPDHQIDGTDPVVPGLTAQGTWMRIAAARTANLAVVFSGEQVSELSIPVDPLTPFAQPGPFLSCTLGSDSLAGGGGETLYRYVCASAEGRFVRYYFRAQASVANPVMRLVLSAAPYTGSNTARFKIRFASGMSPAMGRPGLEASATQAFVAAGTLYELPITLTGLGAGPVWFCVERAWDHPDDLLDATVDLHQVTLRSV